MEIKGKVKHIGDTQTIGANGFQKRELVVTTEEQYPQHILIEFTQNNVNLLDSLQIGMQVIVSINIRGREWTNPQGEVKYFNSIQGWKIEAITTQQIGNVSSNSFTAQQPPMQPVQPTTSFEAYSTTTMQNEDEDDLPF